LCVLYQKSKNIITETKLQMKNKESELLYFI